MSEAVAGRSGKRAFRHVAWSAAVALVAVYLPISEALDNVYHIGSVAGELGGVISFIAVLFAFLLSVISAIAVAFQWILKGRFSSVGLAVLSYSTVTIIFTFIGFLLHNTLDRVAEQHLGEQGRPLIAAITAFVAEQGHPPDHLEDLKSRYFAEIPDTSLVLYPTFEIETCAADKGACFGDDWLLRAEAIETRIMTRGAGGCDRYIFAPSGRYPAQEDYTICHYGSAAGGWAYEYGD